MRRSLAILVVLVLASISICLGGQNPDAKVAVHVMSHEARRTCSKNMPAISDCEDIITTYAGCGDVDFFVVFYDLGGYTGFNYSVTWPGDWSTCSFTSCSDFVIGGIVSPGDSIAQTWTDCDSSSVCITGFGWIGDIETSGYITPISTSPTVTSMWTPPAQHTELAFVEPLVTIPVKAARAAAREEAPKAESGRDLA